LGLPIKKFIAALNRNDVFEYYLKTGNFVPKTAIRTLSNAMDVGNPSNFVRILDIFHHNLEEIRSLLESYSISDDLIRKGIKEVYTKYGYLIDPHGAVGYQSIKLASGSDQHHVILETAHPAKFMDIVAPLINTQIDIPARLKECLDKPKNAILVSDDYQEFKSELISWLS
jgi:threonine synthase